MNVERPREIVEMPGRARNYKTRGESSWQPFTLSLRGGTLSLMARAVGTPEEATIELEVFPSSEALASRADQEAWKHEGGDASHSTIRANPRAVKGPHPKERGETWLIDALVGGYGPIVGASED
jgi:hypothetical protein